MFEQDKGAKMADIEDIKRVLKTYSSLNEVEIDHYLRMCLEEGQDLSEVAAISIKDSVNTMYRI